MIDRVPAQTQQPQRRVRTFHRKSKIPAIVGLGITRIEEDAKKGWLKLTRIGPRAVGAYDDDLADYQRRLQEEFSNTK